MTIGWVFFRSENLSTAITILMQSFSGDYSINDNLNLGVLIVIPILIAIDIMSSNGFNYIKEKKFFSYCYILFLISMTFMLNPGQTNQFIYFEF